MSAAVGAGRRAHAATVQRRGIERFRIKPNGADITDAACAFVLCGLGVLGFKTTYGGTDYLVIGTIAIAFGIALAYIANRLGQPVLGVAVVTVVVFFLFGGAVALRATAVGGVLPTLTTVHALSNASVSGWRDLLTTLPPVGTSDHLLALPYVVGLLGGVTAMCIAGRSRRAATPLLAPVAVLAVGILFGTSKPAALFLQGSVFAAVALGWAALRQYRLHAAVGSRGGAGRVIGAGALLVCGCVGAQTVAAHFPFAHGHQRVVLRTYTQPPFDPGAYPSPLAGFRQYIGPTSKLVNASTKVRLNDTTLFTVAGLPTGTRIRIATTDAYSGLVWGFDTSVSSDATASDVFQRVGSVIPAAIAGTPATAKITVGAYDDVWLPDAGNLTSVTFAGPNAATLASSFRYDLVTGTGVTPTQLKAGDTYQLQLILPQIPDAKILAGASPASSPLPITGAAPQVAVDAKQWTASATGAYAKLQALASHLIDGAYSDGAATGDTTALQVLPGHGSARIANFLKGEQLVGDGEQYATTMALMSNALGYPARVVFGAAPEADGTVKGKDVAAWAEVDFAGIGWIPFNATPPTSHVPTPQKQQQQQTQTNNQVVPPPPVAAPPPVDNPGQATSNDKQAPKKAAPKPTGSGIPRWAIAGATYGGPPVLLVLGFIVVVLAIKSRRRRRRRKRGPSTARIAGGWYEVVDKARDLGVAVPGKRTRREQATAIGDAHLSDLARRADAAIFGLGTPAKADVDRYWQQVSDALRRLKKTVGRPRRLRAALSLRSLRKALDPVASTHVSVVLPTQSRGADADSQMAGHR